MWPFSKKYALTDTEIFSGWTDRHSHILPGVDDGIQTMADSLAVLSYYEQLGVRDLWLTPHIMEDCPNKPSELREHFQQLQEQYVAGREITDGPAKGQVLQGTVNLHLAAENMLDHLFVERLSKNDLLPYGDKGDELLVETSYVQAPSRFKELLQEIYKAGYYPVLAHPERYRYLDYDDYDDLQNMGVSFQLNLPSLAGAYGDFVQGRAEYLLEYGFYKYQGSDTHSLVSIQRSFSAKGVKKKIVPFLNQ